jgi:glutathione S-transferase
MSEELILHQYARSPFSEKVRLAMGVKKLNWRSVMVNNMLPRPHLDLLAGGYRRIPVLQVGADVYCDTHLILRTLDRLRPDSPALFSDSVTQPLCWWWDKSVLAPGVRILVGLHGDKLPEAFIEDRKKFAPGHTFSKKDNEKDIPVNLQRINSHLIWLTDMLADGRQFLLGGSSPSALDVTVYHGLWFIVGGLGNEVEKLLPQLTQPKLSAWFERLIEIGHGTSKEMTPEEAIDVAKKAKPVEPMYIENDSNSGWHVGQQLRVTPDDVGRVPVEGTFIAANNYEIVLRLTNETTGDINIHFPRAGFDVVPV